MAGDIEPSQNMDDDLDIVNDDTNNKERSKKNTTSPSATQKFIYQSCCITIPNNERNLFVLPRLIEKAKMEEGEEDREQGGGDGSERYPILEVYAELKSVLQPACIPHAQGNAWKAKPVTRSYAFEDASISALFIIFLNFSTSVLYTSNSSLANF